MTKRPIAADRDGHSARDAGQRDAAGADSLERLHGLIFSAELTRRSFRSSNGEFGWSREDARLAISILLQQQRAILGGELWWVPDGARDWVGPIPQRQDPPAVYTWDTTRAAGEEWAPFVTRCANDSLQAIERWPGVDDLPTTLGGRILYNLTWVSVNEYREPPSGIRAPYRPAASMRIKLFIAASLLGGVGGLTGSVVGGLLGQRALFAGGLLGGMLIAPLTARLAVWRRWIDPRQHWQTAAGAALGFAAAALVAVNTLSSPVGPVLSVALIGLGAVAGSRRGR